MSVVKFPFTDNPDESAAYQTDGTFHSPRGEWVKKLFYGQEYKLERNAAPFKDNTHNEHQFLHPGLKDYFILNSTSPTAKSPTVVSPVKPVEPAQEFKNEPKLKVAVELKPHAPTPAPVDLEDIDSALPILRRGILPFEQIQFFVDRIQNDTTFSGSLLKIIELSKTDEDMEIPAANAITILNAAGFNLSHYDWSGVRISGADLSGALLDNTRFMGAKLNHVNLQGAWLRGADFTGASLNNLHVGEGPSPDVSAVILQTTYSPSGKWLAVASGGEMQIFDTVEYRLSSQWQAHSKSMNQFAFNHAGTQLVTVSYDQHIKVWCVADGKLDHDFVQTSPLLKAPAGDLNDDEAFDQNAWADSVTNSVAVHPKQPIIATGGADGFVEIRNLQDNKTEKALVAKEAKSFNQVSQKIESLAWDASGHYLAAGRTSGELSLLDLSSKQEKVLKENNRTVTSVCFHPHQSYLVATSKMNHVATAWDLTTGKIIQRYEGHRKMGGITGVSFDPTGERFATCSEDKTIILWEFKSGQVLRRLQGHTDEVISVSFSPDGRQIASASKDNTVRIWEAQARKELRDNKGHRQDVDAMVLNPHNGLLYSFSCDGKIRIWDEQGRSKGMIKTPSTNITGLALDPARNRIYAGGWDKYIRAWDSKNHELVLEQKGLPTLVNHIALSPQGDRLAWGGMDNKVRLIEAASGKVVQEYKGPQGQIMRLAFDSNGEYLAAATEDASNDVFVWNTKNHKPIVLSGHSSMVTDVCFVPGKPVLVSASVDDKLRLWDLNNPDEAARVYQGHTKAVTAITVDPTGKYLLSASDDQTLRLWNIDQEKPLATWPLPYAAKTLIWRKNGENNQLIIAAGTLIICFNLTANKNEYDINLAWQVGSPSFFAHTAIIDKAQGLTNLQARFFHQRGATGKPADTPLAEAKAGRGDTRGDSKDESKLTGISAAAPARIGVFALPSAAAVKSSSATAVESKSPAKLA